MENGTVKSKAPKTVAVEHLVGEIDLSSDKGVLGIHWVKELAQTPGIRPVLTTDALICERTDLSPDHMVRVLTKDEVHGDCSSQIVFFR